MKHIADFGNRCSLFSVDDASIFKSAIEKAKTDSMFPAFITPYSIEEYSKMKMYLLTGGAAGVAINEEREIVSLFKNFRIATKLGIDDVSGKLLFAAISNEGTKLDCYDGFLPHLYVKYGFIPVCKIKFKEEFASPSWDYERDKKPDIIFFRHNGKDIKTILENSKNYKNVNEYDIPYLPNYNSAKKMVSNEEKRFLIKDKQSLSHLRK